MSADTARQASKSYLRKAKKFEMLAQKLEKQHNRQRQQSQKITKISKPTEVKW